MKLYSYVVARDYGFAPNPFYRFCTLATCKPKIRGSAQIGDWIVGTGAKANGLQGKLVFAMHVSETMSFEQYWQDTRFRSKRPNLHGCKKQAYGDNIYHSNQKTKRWIQEDSHHSFPGGKPNQENLRRDTSTNRVLVAETFSYFGGQGPTIPPRFRNFRGYDLCSGRYYQCNFPEVMIQEVVDWLATLEQRFVRAPIKF